MSYAVAKTTQAAAGAARRRADETRDGRGGVAAKFLAGKAKKGEGLPHVRKLHRDTYEVKDITEKADFFFAQHTVFHRLG